MGLQPEIHIIHIEEHGGIVHQCGLVDVDVQPVIGAQHQRGLHGQPALCLRLVGLQSQPPLYLILQPGDTGRGIGKLVGVIVSGNAIGGVVPAEVELSQFPAQGKVIHPVLLRHLIAEAQAVVEEAEAHQHLPSRTFLHQGQGHLVIMVPHAGILAPDRSPALIHGITAYCGDGKTRSQVRLIASQPETAGQNNGHPLVIKGIHHYSTVTFYIQGQFPGGRIHLLRPSP